MATYNIGISKALTNATSAPITRTYSSVAIDLSAYGNTLTTRHLVTANQKISGAYMAGRSSGGTANVSMGVYLTDTGTNAAGNRIATWNYTTTDTNEQWFYQALDIDLTPYVGQYIKPAGGYSADVFRFSTLAGQTSGDSVYVGTSLPTPMGSVTATVTAPLMYLVVEDVVASSTITDINTTEIIAVGGSISATTTGMPTATGMTVGGKTVTNFAGSANAYTGTMPNYVDGQTYPAIGSKSAVITDGTNSPALTVTLIEKAGNSSTTLTSVVVSPGHIGYYITSAIGDRIEFNSAATLGVPVNTIGADGEIFTDYNGLQIMHHWNSSTNVITQLSVTSSTGVTLSDGTMTRANISVSNISCSGLHR